LSITLRNGLFALMALPAKLQYLSFSKAQILHSLKLTEHLKNGGWETLKHGSWETTLACFQGLR